MSETKCVKCMGLGWVTDCFGKDIPCQVCHTAGTVTDEIAKLKELMLEAADTLDIVDERLPSSSQYTELSKQIIRIREAAK